MKRNEKEKSLLQTRENEVNRLQTELKLLKEKLPSFEEVKKGTQYIYIKFKFLKKKLRLKMNISMEINSL